MENLDSTVNKLIILFVLESMEIPLAEDSLVDICFYDLACMQYIDCKEAIVNLLDVGLICQTNPSGSNMVYAITRDGSECLSHFYTRIPSHFRDEITAYCKENRLKLRKQQEYFSDYHKNEDGSYTVILKIMDKSTAILELRLIVESRSNAKWIIKNWCDKAAQIYGTLRDSLMEN